jgi:hypothetical protein
MKKKYGLMQMSLSVGLDRCHKATDIPNMV